jgi:hypothetical protein
LVGEVRRALAGPPPDDIALFLIKSESGRRQKP